MWENCSFEERKILFNLIFSEDLVYIRNIGFQTPAFSSLYSAFLGNLELKNEIGGPQRTNFKHFLFDIWKFDGILSSFAV